MRRKNSNTRNEPWSPAQSSARLHGLAAAAERLQDEERAELRLTPQDAGWLEQLGIETTVPAKKHGC
jgi:hypothetical protein